MKRGTTHLVAALALVVSGCRSTPAPSAFLVVETTPQSGLELATARVEGDMVRAVTLANGKLVVERASDADGALIIRADGACPLSVAAGELEAARSTSRDLTPFFDFGPPLPDVGFGKHFELVARPGCAGATHARITWTQTAGRPLDALRFENDGRKLGATMPSFASLVEKKPSFGIVPVSARARGEVELRATWSDAFRTTAHVVRVSAAARSRGLPNVAVNTRLYLEGNGLHVATAPPGSRAAVEYGGDAPSFTPDANGVYTLEDVHGKNLRLFAGSYEETPLDCSRSDCHADIAASSRSNPMTTVFQRGLDGPFPGDYPACAVACHTVGEPGIDDGGFVTVATRFGFSNTELRRSGFHDLPAPLRRLGGVGCLACHGPGTVAEPAGRDALLRADVCATCHDAPPRYGHVAAWQSSRMARADADPRTRDGACARCHTTWGFLGERARKPPDDAEPVGIACAACHAVHPVRAAAESVIGATCAAALRRETPMPALLGGAVAASAEKSRACFSCHAPEPGDAMPAASAAALWAGRGGLEPSTGAALDGASPHGAVPGGCVGCHASGPPGLDTGTEHGFFAGKDACTACHTEKSDRTVRERALRLWAAAIRPTMPVAGSDPPHTAPPKIDRSTPRGRALWDVALVVEDGAADRHNGAYARALLDAAERVLSPGNGRKVPAP